MSQRLDNNDLSSSQQISEQSQLKQHPAFFIPQDIEAIEPEEQQAFSYLLNVRGQAEKIKNAYKAKIKQQSKQIKQKCQKLLEQSNQAERVFQHNQKTTNKNLSIEQSQWISVWRQQTISNWLCIVQNIKFIQKNNCQAYPINEKNNNSYKFLQKKPLIHQLTCITLSNIQNMLKNCSQHYYYQGAKNYYFWVYCLLAAHKCLANYNIFNQLGFINSCIFAQEKISAQCLVVACILQEQFGQKGLQNVIKKGFSSISSMHDE